MVLSQKFLQLVRSIAVFAWACFVKPLLKSHTKHSNQQQALDHFYGNQAHIYDTTRSVLLKGRKECLQLASAHLPEGKAGLVWVDIGGGTGKNIEMMNEILPIADRFAAVYLVDLSHALCEVARARFASQAWGDRVHVIEADACDFTIDYSHADLITFSYSLLMIPTFNAVVDHAVGLLDRDSGVVACVDFGIQSNDTTVGRINTLGGLVNRNIPWVLRNFWRIWFEADRVFLDSARRNYLEYKFGTLKSLNAYNNTLGRIPYYVWIGCHKSRSHLLLHRINCLATESPYLAPSDETMDAEYSICGLLEGLFPGGSLAVSKGHEAALANFKKNLPFPSIYYQKQPWRVYFDEVNSQYQQFRNQYIYAFTWEDPREDHKILKFSGNDTVLAITSAGDNILAYASLPDPPRKIHAVDLNPCQNHLLELKLASFKGLSRDEIWHMFGEGRIRQFRQLLLQKLSPHMSSNTFQYWMDKGEKTFDVKGKGLYDTGSTRWALRLARAVFAVFGAGAHIDELCECTNMKDQIRIWKTKVKPALFNPLVATLLIGNPIFLWKALGVPANQAEMMGDSVLKYVVDTLEPVVHRSLLSSDNYFYYLTLKGKYHRNNCPDYLTDKGHRNLTTTRDDGTAPIDNIRLHTDTLNDVFARLAQKCITIAIIMDHMDWFDPRGDDAEKEIRAVKECLVPGGRVMLRSAAQYPWYIKTFEKCGFKCKPAAIRHHGESIDRINMYASTWVCTKETDKTSWPGDSRRRMSSLKI
ncbi:S-adenosyl-L-methionine-dependent methyltransferase [Metschnikowia bicuspidata var. bicuspidata NRRL YB-4993]|uniref:S-adenosyl-L-methionine-dependent methyltransferase n=1 Tax=Metschnikowia bicuspidata var. bicuspidata NRRL YB-4993 TaxID=869754 RepID=A0A1A0HA74_9ASCO|nr:S-adenosyl-L-methionine-dependent methyltransferase [Metschnikowia bicuspidata var. bicuspidata NRRL YB-4993]OBA20777.1 S-adenosyl-L-methionine-dependent methyltransferase [Metschnikowia bicuspidata var. bicuspidata NRRL YB-4993]